MDKVKKIVQTTTFKKVVKKLKPNQKSELDNAVKIIFNDPEIGESKKGDLAFMRVFKFKMIDQLTLLGSSYDEDEWVLELLTLGRHENFYRDARKIFNS